MRLPSPDSPEFLNLPALPPPPDIIPNFENPPNLKQPELAVLQLILVTLAVWMRLYTKQFVVRRMLAEDCMCNHDPDPQVVQCYAEGQQYGCSQLGSPSLVSTSLSSSWKVFP
jgi:hypothetical protein